jgi:hypothetical protein
LQPANDDPLRRLAADVSVAQGIRSGRKPKPLAALTNFRFHAVASLGSNVFLSGWRSSDQKQKRQ